MNRLMKWNSKLLTKEKSSFTTKMSSICQPSQRRNVAGGVLLVPLEKLENQNIGLSHHQQKNKIGSGLGSSAAEAGAFSVTK